MQMRQTKMRVHGVYVVKEAAPSECDTDPSKNIAQAIPKRSIQMLLLPMEKTPGVKVGSPLKNHYHENS